MLGQAFEGLGKDLVLFIPEPRGAVLAEGAFDGPPVVLAQKALCRRQDEPHLFGHVLPLSTLVLAQCLVKPFGDARHVRLHVVQQSAQSLQLGCALFVLVRQVVDQRTAFVTTARKGLSADDLAVQPLADGLFAFTAPAPGLPATEWVFPQ